MKLKPLKTIIQFAFSRLSLFFIGMLVFIVIILSALKGANFQNNARILSKVWLFEHHLIVGKINRWVLRIGLTPSN